MVALWTTASIHSCLIHTRINLSRCALASAAFDMNVSRTEAFNSRPLLPSDNGYLVSTVNHHHLSRAIHFACQFVMWFPPNEWSAHRTYMQAHCLCILMRQICRTGFLFASWLKTLGQSRQASPRRILRTHFPCCLRSNAA